MRDELREKIAHIIGYHCFPSVIDAKNQHWYYEIADSILALIDAERCVWKKENNGINVYLTSCNMIEVFEGYTYCPCCGKKIEVSP